MRVVPYVTGAAGMSWVTATAIIVLLIAVGIAYTWIVTPSVHRHEMPTAGEIHEEPEPRPLLRRAA